MKKIISCLAVMMLSTNLFAADGVLNISLDNKTIASQIPMFSKVYNKPIVVDPQIREKKMTVSASKVSVDEAKHVIAKSLSLSGISIIETKNDVSIVAAKEALKSGIETYKNKVENPTPERMVTLVLDLPKDLSAFEVEKTIRSLYSRDGDVKVFQNNNQIMITDWTSNVIRLQNVISSLERSKTK